MQDRRSFLPKGGLWSTLGSYRYNSERGNCMSGGKTALTDEIRALIGTTGERVEASLWGIEKEDQRRFT